MIDCDGEYSSLLLSFDSEYYFEIPNYSFIIDYFDVPGFEDMCVLGLLVSQDDQFRIGSIFYTNFYVYHDMENAQIGIAQPSSS
mmetsp:Transcript_7095/g.6207  ORF Transcript_7095/g.6207 Transcript_7095/m.6207 type:complete len:84 (-) Transcript_7095:128-379(-)